MLLLMILFVHTLHCVDCQHALTLNCSAVGNAFVNSVNAILQVHKLTCDFLPIFPILLYYYTTGKQAIIMLMQVYKRKS